MGGMDGFGPVVPEQNEPVFHADWERRAYALVSLVMGAAQVNVDEFRHAIERIPPARYLASSYYERWIAAAETVLVEHGIATRDELLAKEDAAIDPRQIANAVATHGPAPVKDKPGSKLPRARFAKGDRVRARNINPSGHTRLPRYVRGKAGVIARDWGVFVFPDTNAHHAGSQAATLLLGLVRRARAVGQTREQSRATVHRFVGRLFGTDHAENNEAAKRKTVHTSG